MDGIATIIDFEMLFNEDYGLIKTIVDKYNNPKYTNDEYLKKVSFEKIINDLLNQEKNDPLQLVFKKGVNYSDIYNQLYENDIDYIVSYSCPTKLIGLVVELLRYNSKNTITVICKNKYEEQKIEEFYHPIMTVNINDIDINTLDYDCYYCKDIKNIDLFKEIKFKYIYIANYKYNLNSLEEIKNNEELTSKLYLNNLELIDLY